MDTKKFPSARKFVARVLLAIAIVMTALMLTFSAAPSVARAGDIGGGNSMINLSTPTPTK